MKVKSITKVLILFGLLLMNTSCESSEEKDLSSTHPSLELANEIPSFHIITDWEKLKLKGSIQSIMTIEKEIIPGYPTSDTSFHIETIHFDSSGMKLNSYHQGGYDPLGNYHSEGYSIVYLYDSNDCVREEMCFLGKWTQNDPSPILATSAFDYSSSNFPVIEITRDKNGNEIFRKKYDYDSSFMLIRAELYLPDVETYLLQTFEKQGDTLIELLWNNDTPTITNKSIRNLEGLLIYDEINDSPVTYVSQFSYEKDQQGNWVRCLKTTKINNDSQNEVRTTIIERKITYY